jgi:hypothetical protein
MSPSLKWTPEINADDFAEHAGVNTFKIRSGW